jgi:hypothetical protein
LLAIDSTAQRILAKVYWDAGGWKRPPEMPGEAEFALACAAGYMFEDVVMGHDDLVHQTRLLAQQLTIKEASDAFVASLSTRWLFLRPLLPSLIIARSLPQHEFQPTSRPEWKAGGIGPCAVCNTWCKPDILIDRNILNFERQKWGGVRHLDLTFVWFCLDRLRQEGGALPTKEDVDLLRALLDALREAPPTMSLTQAETLIRLLKSTKQERHMMLESLSTISVLEESGHRGFLHSFPQTIDRQVPNRRFVDRGYPGEWWTGASGVNGRAVAEVFPQLA